MITTILASVPSNKSLFSLVISEGTRCLSSFDFTVYLLIQYHYLAGVCVFVIFLASATLLMSDTAEQTILGMLSSYL